MLADPLGIPGAAGIGSDIDATLGRVDSLESRPPLMVEPFSAGVSLRLSVSSDYSQQHWG